MSTAAFRFRAGYGTYARLGTAIRNGLQCAVNLQIRHFFSEIMQAPYHGIRARRGVHVRRAPSPQRAMSCL